MGIKWQVLKLFSLILVRQVLICAVIALIASILCDQENETFGQNLGNEQQCVHINWTKTLSQEQLERVKEFRQGWFSQDQLPSFQVSQEEQQWIFDMSTLHLQKDFAKPSSRGEFKSFKEIKQQSLDGSAPNCFELPDGLQSQNKYHQLSSEDPIPQRIRKEYRQLSSEERNSLHKAYNTMKKVFPFKRNISVYDLLVSFHRKDMAPTAHFGASFLPWHRHYLLM